MGYSSVDAAIAQNLHNKGNQFSPILNQEMQIKFIKITEMTESPGKSGQ